MGLKIRLIKDGEVLLEIPISIAEWSKENLESEMNMIEEEFQKFSRILSALSNETCMKMMWSFMMKEDSSLRFAELMQSLNLNPKIVWENLGRLSECGFLEKIGRGRYRCSEYGRRAFMLMGLAMRQILDAIEEI